MTDPDEGTINIDITLDEFADVVEAQHADFMAFAPQINAMLRGMGADEDLFSEEFIAEKDREARESIAAMRAPDAEWAVE